MDWRNNIKNKNTVHFLDCDASGQRKYENMRGLWQKLKKPFKVFFRLKGTQNANIITYILMNSIAVLYIELDVVNLEFPIAIKTQWRWKSNPIWWWEKKVTLLLSFFFHFIFLEKSPLKRNLCSKNYLFFGGFSLSSKLPS